MDFSTADLWDAHHAMIDVCDAQFRSFGLRRRFSGACVTVKTPGDHRQVRALAVTPGAGRVIVVGHTDDQPIHSLTYKDNFALSAARARSVMQILGQGLDDAGRLESSGAGASQPIALPPNLPANRTRNRRVEIKYIPEG